VNDVTYNQNYITLPSIQQLTFEAINPKFFKMPLLTILLVIIVVGVLLWLVNSFIPMDGKIKSIFNVVVVIILVVWLLKVFGILGTLTDIHI
jgi:hypothetical protein